MRLRVKKMKVEILTNAHQEKLSPRLISLPHQSEGTRPTGNVFLNLLSQQKEGRNYVMGYDSS